MCWGSLWLRNAERGSALGLVLWALRLGFRAEVSGAFAVCSLLSCRVWLSTAQAQAGFSYLDFFLVHKRENINASWERPHEHRKRDPVTQSLACMSPQRGPW